MYSVLSWTPPPVKPSTSLLHAPGFPGWHKRINKLTEDWKLHGGFHCASSFRTKHAGSGFRAHPESAQSTEPRAVRNLGDTVTGLMYADITVIAEYHFIAILRFLLLIQHNYVINYLTCTVDNTKVQVLTTFSCVSLLVKPSNFTEYLLGSTCDAD